MRHRAHRYRLGRESAHRLAMVRNLLVALFRHERITTTETKAKAVRPLADRIVTLAKQESLHARRQALAMVPDAQVVARLFDTIAARFSDRHGGYTRIIKNGVRRGDAAPLVFLELVDRADTGADKDKDKADRKAKPARGRAQAGRRGKKKEKAAASS
ncbi:MAG TPA: 50S ribosomal protein L17 [Methylomirabilota bacterium]|nr:50S ribosomal protein L17 [Methylomirabilota bacterium]